MKCRSCGADNPDDAILCGKCGAPLRTVFGPKSSILLYVVGIYLGILSIMMPVAYMTNNGVIQGLSVIAWFLGGVALFMGWLSPQK
jgi:cytochrome c oxidase assembly factor CtaG